MLGSRDSRPEPTIASRRGAVVAAGLAMLLGSAALGCSGDDDDTTAPASGEPTSSADRAPAGMAQVLLPADADLTLEPLSGAVGTETTLLSLVGIAEPEEIGRGDAARQPAEGERFVVISLTRQNTPPDDSVASRVDQAEMQARGTATFAVQVGEAAPVGINLDTPSYTPLPIDLDQPPGPPAAEDPVAAQQRLLVVSVPEGAESVDLVVTSQDLAQRLSLLTGAPGPDNVAVLARANRALLAPVGPQEVSYTQTDFGFSDSRTEAVSVAAGSLQWASGGTGVNTFAAPGRAHLVVVLEGGFFPALASELRLPDGSVVQPTFSNEDSLASLIPIAIFDVPADFTSGVLVYGKDFTWEVPTGGSMSGAFDNMVEYPIEIPPAT